MSFSVKKNRITLTRGDTFIDTLQLYKEGEPFVPHEGDSIRFALKHPTMNAARTEYTDTEPLLVKTIPTDTMVLRIESAETKDLGFGDYVYDIQLTYANGDVDTFITEAQFRLTPEVD